MADIELTGVTKVFDGDEPVVAVDAVDLAIASGELVALLGPSGCGKTTLLRILAGLEAATAGTVRIGGRDVTDAAPGDRGVAMVFQDYALFPHMTVAENVGYPLRVRKVPRREREAAVAAATDPLSLGGLLGRRPSQLSGGQQQRTALARALAARPDVCLLDEPLSNLDARLRLDARTELKRIQVETGVTSVYVTHDQAEALALADRVVVMADGRVQQVGTPAEVFRRPATAFVAGFVGHLPMNLLPGRITGGALEVVGTRLPLTAAEDRADGEVLVGVRPEQLALAPPGGGPADGRVAGTVEVTQLLGVDHLLAVGVGGTRVHLTAADEVPAGTAVEVDLGAAPRLLYDPAGGALLTRADPRSTPAGPRAAGSGPAVLSGPGR